MTGPRTLAVVGPSGVGKDSLIAGLAARGPRLRPLRRVVTRPADETEPFLSVDPACFARMEAAGAFVLSWDAHGLRYGVPRAEVAALGPGQTGLVNLSRGVLDRAAAVLPGLAVLSVTAPADVLARRLAGRGREKAADIAARLARPAPPIPAGLPVLELDNGGALEASVDRVLDWLAQAAPE
ncbi:phosphonate metabolism protein/1,5-bisphosphokinase (PRPP-forming) PhnN [Jannaschia seohaensis]|uniref:Ribose 1,5-bisphosphokinase n=1 Tax=Jannaschia seohaensis TaxID=475081 RepID=A0A2Y9A3Y8_9RHOB|nr:phosphonate metabolism protein/1,5-bisphosphokinase (PRPP-forming) PhnN [Jannaschia seohaensis]PWJ21890.1 ribose 1,5-bisphosphokinase [Jannaschia seohaensis]SSA38168.1 ribose 1,5-bisphosphokinase [Jannaschia seohaensis]